MKAKMVIEGMHKWIAGKTPEQVDIVKATQALRMLEERVEVLKHIKSPPVDEGDANKLVF
jgi:hypothetical protein